MTTSLEPQIIRSGNVIYKQFCNIITIHLVLLFKNILNFFSIISLQHRFLLNFPEIPLKIFWKLLKIFKGRKYTTYNYLLGEWFCASVLTSFGRWRASKNMAEKILESNNCSFRPQIHLQFLPPPSDIWVAF